MTTPRVPTLAALALVDNHGMSTAFRYAKDFPEGTVCVDLQEPQTGLRGMVIRGPFSFCAYVGAPENHALYSLEELEFRCHFGITFRGQGSEVGCLPAGWYFFGWDYAHFTDRLALDPLQGLVFGDSREAEALQALFEKTTSGQFRKDWTVEEVTEDVLDVLVELREALQQSERFAQALRPTY